MFCRWSSPTHQFAGDAVGYAATCTVRTFLAAARSLASAAVLVAGLPLAGVGLPGRAAPCGAATFAFGDGAGVFGAVTGALVTGAAGGCVSAGGVSFLHALSRTTVRAREANGRG